MASLPVRAAVAIACMSAVLNAQALMTREVVNGLRAGGFVLVMRHASSPREAPTRETARPDNSTLERQLDERGRTDATNMGQALRRLRIPIGEVLSSPTYRARETVRLAGLSNPVVVTELGDGGQSMQGVTDAQASWLRAKVGTLPPRGNIILVTHLPNLSSAFPDWGPTVADGEMIVLGPDRQGRATVVGRVKIEEWASLQ